MSKLGLGSCLIRRSSPQNCKTWGRRHLLWNRLLATTMTNGACKRDDRSIGVPTNEKVDKQKSAFRSIWRIWSLFSGWIDAFGVRNSHFSGGRIFKNAVRTFESANWRDWNCASAIFRWSLSSGGRKDRFDCVCKVLECDDIDEDPFLLNLDQLAFYQNGFAHHCFFFEYSFQSRLVQILFFLFSCRADLFVFNFFLFGFLVSFSISFLPDISTVFIIVQC